MTRPDRERHGPRASATVRTVETEAGARLHVVDHVPDEALEPGAPTVVLAHGWNLDHTTWDPVVSALQSRRRVRVVTYDQPGHGRSSLGRGRRPQVAGLGDALRDVIAATAPVGPLVLGGHSMGGMTVMAYAGAHHEQLRARARGVLLVATAPEVASLRRPVRGERVVMGLQALLPGMMPGLPMTPAMVRANVFGAGARDADVREVRALLNRTRARTTGRYFFAILGHDETASLSRLEGIPTVVVAGERDRLTPRPVEPRVPRPPPRSRPRRRAGRRSHAHLRGDRPARRPPRVALRVPAAHMSQTGRYAPRCRAVPRPLTDPRRTKGRQ